MSPVCIGCMGVFAVKNEMQRRLAFERRYKRFLIAHTSWVILYMALLEFLPMICMFYLYDVHRKNGNMLFSLVVVGLSVFFVWFMLPVILGYAKEIVTLYMGKMVLETGIIKSKRGRIYEIQLTQTRNVRNRQTKAQRKQKKSTEKYKEQTEYITTYCAIDRCARESKFEEGDQITLICAATDILRLDGMSGGRMGIGWRSAIYAFAGEIPPEIVARNRRFSKAQYQIAFEIFILVAAFLFCILIAYFFCTLTL